MRGLLAFFFAGCCLDGLPPIAPAATPAIPPPTATGGPHMPGGPGSAIFGRIAVSAGFAPDPIFASGLAGGPAALSTFLTGCIGYANSVPSHHLTVEGETAIYLRLMANAPGGNDLTLAVRGSDGSPRCNDDTDGLMPVVDGTFGPGEYDVWVGTYGIGLAGVAYDLGVTTVPGLLPTTMRSSPPVAPLPEPVPPMP